jgi:hypothetical protein
MIECEKLLNEAGCRSWTDLTRAKQAGGEELPPGIVRPSVRPGHSQWQQASVLRAFVVQDFAWLDSLPAMEADRNLVDIRMFGNRSW